MIQNPLDEFGLTAQHLSKDEKDFLDSNGFLLLRNVLTQDQFTELLNRIQGVGSARRL